MQLDLGIQDGEFPYKADYIGYQPLAALTAPIIENLGLPPRGKRARSYSGLLEFIVRDLKGCPETIEVRCSDGLSGEQQAVVKTLVGLLNEYNAAQLRLFGVSQAISKTLKTPSINQT